MLPKARVLALALILDRVESENLVAHLGYKTRAGAASVLLRLYHHGYLSREGENVYRGVVYHYVLTEKGKNWLRWYGARQSSGGFLSGFRRLLERGRAGKTGAG